MEPLTWTWGSAVLTMFAGTLCLSGADTATEQEKLSPPSNLMATVKDLFVVNWTWDAPTNLPNVTKCDLKYTSELNGRMVRHPFTFRTDTPNDLNKEMCFKVQSVCLDKNDSIESIWVENCGFLLKGDLQPPVKDFKCNWIEGEPMECTWHLGKGSPPDTNYVLIYRTDGLNNRCQAYTYEEGVVNGCAFINETFQDSDKINILITDSAMTLGRFYTSFEPISILKPRPLNITVRKLPSNRIHVTWNDSNYFHKDYEVQWKNSKSETWTTDSVSGQLECTTDSINPDSKYTVRVRSKFHEFYGAKLWSDWSTEATIGEQPEDEWTLNFILFFTIPLAVATATILLLVSLKRIRIFIFPPIPDPSEILSRIFPEHSEERKHWIQHVSAMYPENPVKEEICSVTLLEPDTSAETQHDLTFTR